MKNMYKICVFDTCICSENTGDYIIMESVYKILRHRFSDSFFYNVATHEKLNFESYRLIRKSDYRIVGGTNLLSSNMHVYNQWKINLLDMPFLKGVILMGVGWWQYQQKPNKYSAYLLKSVLSRKGIHSVRDAYTQKMLASIGITNVINTGCPTMWNLTEAHCREIPEEKADAVIFTLTDYNQDPVNDKRFLDMLLKSYNEVYFWPQGSNDYEYIKKLKYHDRVAIIAPQLERIYQLLGDDEKSLDYVGTRLHAGIAALQHKRRSIILGIDNRAVEISNDCKLKVIQRRHVDDLKPLIHSSFETKIDLPASNIQKWLAQFK